MANRRTMTINGQEVPIRSYEVSIWTLQDSFITVLKWANLENKGQIEEPDLILDTDGTQNFKFSLPMYLDIGIDKKENPIWYNTRNGNLMVGLRKIKVILNKKTEDEAIFEFVITKVIERHEEEQLYCDVECEGLAFHELGKIGYKISLSAEEFNTYYESCFKNGEALPHQTIQYWNEDKCGLERWSSEITPIPNIWYYDVQMNWLGEASHDKDKIYEDAYVSSWKEENGVLKPKTVQTAREKERPVEIEESNLYNITQTIAEAFGVFCRYEYQHDDNYHIIARKIIYYNNFIQEENGFMDLTYPYHTTFITREIDSTDLVTKMFVRPVDYEMSDSGKVTIMSVDANKSREDYLLNFDYLHKFNIITDEQYEEVSNYEIRMNRINKNIEDTWNKKSNLEKIILDEKANQSIELKQKDEAKKQMDVASSYIGALNTSSDDKAISLSGANAKACMLIKETDTDKYYIKMPVNGIIPSTVKLYAGIIDYTNVKDPFNKAHEITDGVMEFDEFNNLVYIRNLDNTLNEVEFTSFWLTCEYVPETYWTNVLEYWTEVYNQHSTKYSQISTKLEDDKDQKIILENQYQEYLEEKDKEIKAFEHIMGPALREGYWQPENYNDYGDKYEASFGGNSEVTEDGYASYIWDTKKFDGDNKITYEEGAEPTTKYYLMAELQEEDLPYIKENFSNLSFIYYDKSIVELNEKLKNEENVSESQQIAYIRNALRNSPVGSQSQFGFVMDNGVRKPVLIITDSSLFTEEQIKFIKDSVSEEERFPCIGVLNGNEIENSPIKIENFIEGTPIAVNPRIKIDSLSLNTSSNELLVNIEVEQETVLLKEYEDYYILIENNAYYISLKPKIYFQYGSLNPKINISYSISNADTCIYLDALKIAKENSEPKVSYEVKLNLYNPNLIHSIYNKLAQIVHINDNDLKFENVQGYISHMELKLDAPWEDSIEVKNYKNKFEDLFSTIVASSESMKKNEFNYDVAAAAFMTDGSLTPEATTKMLQINAPIFKTYIDEHLTSSPVIRNTLTSLFNEAGQVLSGAGNALADIRALTSENADILAGFVRGADEGFSRGIDLISSKNGEYTSAVQINNQGIFIGSDQKISLYSGVIGETSGVSIDLSPERLILGASSDQNATAAKFTEKYLVLASGDIITDSETYNEDGELIKDLNITNVTGTINDLIGAKFTKDSIGFATYNNNIINSILMNDKGITLGSAVVNEENEKFGININDTTENLRKLNIADASYVRISSKGIDIGSGGELYVNTANLIINSAATDTESIFELKKLKSNSNNEYDTALKYNITNGLEITGAIKATEFKIQSGNEFKNFLDSEGHINEALIDSSKYSISGLTSIDWGEQGKKEKYVALTSEYGLLFGANKGIIIPRNTPKSLDESLINDNESDSLETTVSINKEGISFDYYSETDIKPSSYIHMNKDGLQVSGERISINGNDVWARDDIVIMNPNVPDSDTANTWRKSVESIEQKMAGKGDWVLIRPYYDAETRSEMKLGTTIIPSYSGSDSNYTATLQLMEPITYFGDGSSKYEYWITGNYFVNQVDPEGYNQTINFQPHAEKGSNSRTIQRFSYVIPSQNQYDSGVFETTHSIYTDAKNNLFVEGWTIYLEMNNRTVDNGIRLSELVLHCKCDATTSKVPCTVYYYPKISSTNAEG